VPIQIAYLGFPGTVGGRFIDYIIADPYVVPDESLKHYREKIIRIEKTYQVNDYDLGAIDTLPRLSRKDLGFSDATFILGMFNNCNKITQECWQTWMEILKKIPQAVIWMLQPNVLATENLRKAAQQLGVNPQRIIFAPRLDRDRHYQRLKICDLVLDPWPYGGHTTTADALYAGIPALTREGHNFAARVSGGLMIAAGLPGWIVKNEDAYIQAAVNLVKNPDLLVKTKEYLNENRSRLNIFNSKVKALQLEAAYKKIINNRLEGKPDEHITIQYGRKR
jgi:predicted O-linked N-acetylglucosamine transferase (SPINDLY family)